MRDPVSAEQNTALDRSTTRRRAFVVGATTISGVVAASSEVEAQVTANPKYFNPAGMFSPPTYSQVVEVTGPNKTIYIAGQTGVDAGGKTVEGGFHAQIVQVMENLKVALASAGASFDNVVKINSCLTDMEKNATEYRAVRAQYFTNKAAQPASTLVQVGRLADPTQLVEVEVIAVVPLKA